MTDQLNPRPPISFFEACLVVADHGYQAVKSDNYERLRSWLDLNGWPPMEWNPPVPTVTDDDDAA